MPKFQVGDVVLGKYTGCHARIEKVKLNKFSHEWMYSGVVVRGSLRRKEGSAWNGSECNITLIERGQKDEEYESLLI